MLAEEKLRLLQVHELGRKSIQVLVELVLKILDFVDFAISSLHLVYQAGVYVVVLLQLPLNRRGCLSDLFELV